MERQVHENIGFQSLAITTAVYYLNGTLELIFLQLAQIEMHAGKTNSRRQTRYDVTIVSWQN